MSESVLIEVSPGETRVAILDESGRLVELLIERADRPASEGGIHLGRVRRVEPALNGAFVALGDGEDGFLRRAKGLHEGQAVLVQVTREAGDGKGSALTDKPSVVGRYLALHPDRSEVSYSARLGSGRRRAQLEALAPQLRDRVGEGIAIRAAAADATDDDILVEAARLVQDWDEIREAASSAAAPALLVPPSGLIARALRDREGGVAVIDDPQAFRAAEQLVRDRMPDRRGLLKRHDERTPVFESYGVAEDVDGVCDRVVTLEGGAQLTIDPLEALTAIDIDSGAGGRRGADDAVLRTNRAVLPEIARQVRLRNLSGLIVVDFLRMRRKDARAQLVQAARRAFRDDPVQVDVLGMTAAGLLELTRRRGAPPLHELLLEPAAPVRAAGSDACALLRAVLRLTGAGRPVARAAPAVIAALQGPFAAARAEVDRRMGQPLDLRAEPGRRDWEVRMEQVR